MESAQNLGKSIKYKLGYSNFTFELWMILHKNDPRFIPDAWVKSDSDEIPVEIKLHNFNQAAVNQLNQYMKFYHSRKGIAVGKKLTVAIPPEINFIPISMLLINK